MDETIKLLIQLGAGGIMMWAALIMMRATNKNIEGSQDNMASLIELFGKAITDIKDAIVHMSVDFNQHMDTLAQQITDVALLADESRESHNEQTNAQLTNIITVLDNLATSMTGIATKEDLAALNGMPAMLNDITNTLREIKSVIIVSQSGAPETV